MRNFTSPLHLLFSLCVMSGTLSMLFRKVWQMRNGTNRDSSHGACSLQLPPQSPYQKLMMGWSALIFPKTAFLPSVTRLMLMIISSLIPRNE